MSKSKWIAFGKLLKSNRQAAGLSRYRLARLADLSEATIKKLERGQMASERTLLDLYSVHELGWRKGDFPVSVEHKTQDEFLRWQLRYLILRSSEHAYHKVLKWAGIQTQTAEIRALDKWAKQKLRIVEAQLHRLDPQSSSNSNGFAGRRGGRRAARSSGSTLRSAHCATANPTQDADDGLLDGGK